MRGYLAILMLGLTVTVGHAQETLPVKTVSALKEATVMITTTVEADGVGEQRISSLALKGTGSNVLCRRVRSALPRLSNDARRLR